MQGGGAIALRPFFPPTAVLSGALGGKNAPRILFFAPILPLFTSLNVYQKIKNRTKRAPFFTWQKLIN